MLIFLHNFNVSPKQTLQKSGYKPHPKKKKEWVLEESVQGRFHAREIDKRAFEVHYDCYIEGKHVSGFSLPIKHNAERKRIFKTIRRYQKGFMEKEQFWKLNKYYANKELIVN